MKLRLPCEICLGSLNELAISPDEWNDFIPANDLQDSSVYEVNCKRGHLSRVIIVNPKFELLFESGIEALKDGYYREAVSSFAVSLERFYEFSIRAFLRPLVSKIGQNYFDDTWRILSKQSERQIGAFYALYLNSYGKVPLLFDGKFLSLYNINLGIKSNDPTDFRNKIIHAGYVPTKSQALSYGEGVNFYIRTSMKDFFNNRTPNGLNVAKLIMDDADSVFNSQKEGINKISSIYTFMRFYQPFEDITSSSLIRLAQNGYNPHA